MSHESYLQTCTQEKPLLPSMTQSQQTAHEQSDQSSSVQQYTITSHECMAAGSLC